MAPAAPQRQHLLRCKCSPRHQRDCALQLLPLQGSGCHEKALNTL